MIYLLNYRYIHRFLNHGSSWASYKNNCYKNFVPNRFSTNDLGKVLSLAREEPYAQYYAFSFFFCFEANSFLGFS